MDGNSTSQSSDLTERSHRRRLSSILKVPRSPLKCLGTGNELCQEPAIDKRRTSSRRVSFAETIRVFTPELQVTGSTDQENEGFGSSVSCSNIIKGPASTCEIAGMDTLLHGPIQVPGHNADWDYSDGAKDRTILFSSDTDMDMTSSNTIAIHRLIEEKPKKIDTSLFLASLKAQTSEEAAKNKDLPLPTGSEKSADFTVQRDPSMEKKIKFSDFLASLSGDKSKATGDVKENTFPFAPTQDNTGNVTQMFREQDDGLDLTRCHTTNIDSLFPTFSREIPSHVTSTSQPKPLSVSQLGHVKGGDLHRFTSNDQTVFIEDDMDMTRSHTTRIGQVVPTREVRPHTSQSQADKTVHLDKENEMEFTKNKLILPKGNPGVTSIQREERVFGFELITLLPQGEDMDMTRSHRQSCRPQDVQLQTSRNETFLPSDKTIRFDNEMELTRNNPNVTIIPRNERVFGLELTTLLPQGEDMDMTRSHTMVIESNPVRSHNQSVKDGTVHKTSSCRPQDVQLQTSRNETFLPSDKTIRFDNENEMELTRNNPNVTTIPRNERVFGLELTTLLPQGEDMDVTRSHTTRIRQSCLAQEERLHTSRNETFLPSDKTICFDKENEMELTRNNSVFLNENRRVTSIQQKVFCMENTTLHPAGEDMDLTCSHTTHVRQSSPQRDAAQMPTCPTEMALASDKTIHFDKENEMELTRNNSVFLNRNPNITTIPRKERVFGLELTTLLPQGEDMDMTRSHTMVIESNPVRSHNQLVKDGTVHHATHLRQSCRPQDVQLQTSRNETFLPSDKTIRFDNENEMELTRNNPNVTIIPRNERVFGLELTTFLPQGEDMDMTRSHTMVIESNPIRSHNQSVKDGTVNRVNDMELTRNNPNVTIQRKESVSGLELTTLLPQGKDIDVTRGPTTHIRQSCLAQEERLHTSRNETAFVPDKTILFDKENEMELTRNNPNVTTIQRKERVFGLELTTLLPQGEDMDMTRSHTMVIENNPVRSHNQSVKDGTVHQVNNMEMTNINAGLLTTARKSQSWNKVNLPFESFKDKTLYLGDQDDMDMTRTHTVAIENKLIEEMGNDRVKSVSQNVTSALINKESVFCLEHTTLLPQGEDMDITRSHTMVIERNPVGLHDQSNSVKNITLANSATTNTIYWENDPACKALKQQLNNVTVLQEGDMQMTTVNTGLLTAARKSQSWNKVNPSFESFKDKTLYLGDQDDMDMTRTHTVAIENKLIEETGNDRVTSTSQNVVCSASIKSHLGGDKNVSRPRSVHDFSGRNDTDQDMDITRSNTGFIASNKPGNDLQLPMSSRRSLVEGKTLDLELGRDRGIDRTFDKDNRNHFEKHTRVSIESLDKTIFLYEQNDMDVTKSHTTAIASEILEGAEVKNVNTKTPTNRSRTALLTNNSLQLPILSRRSLVEGRPVDLEMRKHKGIDLAFNKDSGNLWEKTIFLYEQNDMDITRSHTTAVESQMLEGTIAKNVNTEKQTNRNAVLEPTNNDSQHPLVRRSLVGGRASDLEMGRNTDIIAGNHLEKYTPVSMELQDNSVFLYEQNDMDVTKSHTTAIEGKILESMKTKNTPNLSDRAASVTYNNPQHPVLSRRSLVEGRASDLEMRRDKDIDQAFEKDEGNHLETQAPVSIESPAKTIFLYGQNDMDVTRSHTTAIENKLLESTKATNAVLTSNTANVTSTNMMKDEDMDMTNSNTVFIDHLSDQLCDRSLHVSDILPKRKSVSYRQKSLAFSDETVRLVCNMEETELNVRPTENLMNKSSFDKTVCNQGEIEMTKSHTVAIENKTLDVAPVTYPVRVCSPVSRSMTLCEMDQTRPQAASNDGARVESVPLVPKRGVPENKPGSENGFQNQLLESKSLEMTGELRSVKEIGSLSCDPLGLASDSRDVVRPEQPKTPPLPPVKSLTFPPQKDAEMSPEKKKVKGKRVSFLILDQKTVDKDVMSDQVTEMFVSQQVNPDQVERQDKSVQNTEQMSDLKSNLIDQVTGTVQDTENVEEKSLHKDPDVSETNVGFPEDISSNIKGFGTLQKGRSHRRSVADIQLKIKGLTQKWKVSPHHTAPVSSLIDQLPAAPQIVEPSGSEQGLNEVLPNAEDLQKKLPNDEQNKATNLLPNRLSLKVFQPKLPNKRASSTSNLPKVVVSSGPEAPPQNNQCPTALLKTLSVTDNRPSIDEEILPACSDDQELNSILPYEVPEGAWEELFQNEALQQNLTGSTAQPKDSTNAQKRVRYSEEEEDDESQQEKRARWNEDLSEKGEAQTTTAFRSSDKSYRSEDPHASKTMEQTCYSSSSSSQDSRAGGMSVELSSSQQSSQMDSQLPWDNGCENSLWQKFQDGTITVQEFFMLLRIHILIQKPRYSERPSKRGMKDDVTASEILLDQYVYQPKLQVYEEECHTMYQKMEELKVSTELQHKPLVQVNSVLWEALRMCSENELMYFGVSLKNMKSLYSKRSKRIAHEEKVSTYTKLLHSAQTQSEQLQTRLSEADRLLGELGDCISSIGSETERLTGECRDDNLVFKDQGCMQIQTEIDGLKSQEQSLIRQSVELEDRKEKVLEQLGRLQGEAQVMEKRLDQASFSEWEMVKWTDTEAAFTFLYGCLELSISFGDYIDGENFNNQPCRKISSVTVESQLEDEAAPPSSCLVHRLIFQFVEKKKAFHETYKTQKDVPQLLFDLSLVVSRCRLLGEELEYLIKWGGLYNISRVQVHGEEVRLLFSSSAALTKFELIIQLSDTYPTAPLTFTMRNLIGSVTNSRIAEIMVKVTCGLWYLKRTVKSIYENLLK